MNKDAIGRILDSLEHAHGLKSTCGIQQCNCIDAQDWRDLKKHFTPKEPPAKWCCKGVKTTDPTVDQHEPHCQYHYSANARTANNTQPQVPK